MEVHDFFLLDSNKEITNDSYIKCKECDEFSHITRWTESESYCEDCGSHIAMKCPVCEEIIDMVFIRNVEVK